MTIKVLAMGQSNMVGIDSSNVPDFATVSASARFWNNVNPLGANGTAFVSATAARTAGAFPLPDRNNMPVWFADKLARATFTAVDTVVVARQGSPISYWSPSEATFPLYAEAVAVWGATGQGPADVLMWHQGENDVTDGTTATYIANFEQMVSNLIAAGVLSANTLILLGGIAEQTLERTAFNKTCLLPLAGKRGWAYASSYGLTVIDGVHFNSASLTDLGARRYFSAYQFARATAA